MNDTKKSKNKNAEKLRTDHGTKGNGNHAHTLECDCRQSWIMRLSVTQRLSAAHRIYCDFTVCALLKRIFFLVSLCPPPPSRPLCTIKCVHTNTQTLSPLRKCRKGREKRHANKGALPNGSKRLFAAHRLHEIWHNNILVLLSTRFQWTEPKLFEKNVWKKATAQVRMGDGRQKWAVETDVRWPYGRCSVTLVSDDMCVCVSTMLEKDTVFNWLLSQFFFSRPRCLHGETICSGRNNNNK